MQNMRDRYLPDVFKELKEIQHSQHAKNTKGKHINIIEKNKGKTLKIPAYIIFLILCAIFVFILFCTNTISSAANVKDTSEENIKNKYFEPNNNTLDIQNIINNNIEVIRKKEVVHEERDIEFETVYNNDDTLPKGEQVVTREGTLGREKVKAVRVYENDNFLSENITERHVIKDAISKMVSVGTSEFLANYNIHIGDTLYIIKNTKLLKEPNSNSTELLSLSELDDVTLLGLSNNYCKVSINATEGFVDTNSITSSTKNPELAEKSRVYKLKKTLFKNMDLRKPSGFTLSDFNKILSKNSYDKNKVFENNAQTFYNVEQKYKINAIFLASVAIHESGWGTSVISTTKYNLFGYGSFDRDPYNSSFTFSNYAEGIETVAKVFIKHYLNPPNTPIYNNEIASGKYYSEPTLEGVNKRYCTDTNWSNKVFNYMEKLYNKL